MRIEQKGMTFDHDFCYSFSLSSSQFFLEGREKGKRKTKVVVKRHVFLLDPINKSKWSIWYIELMIKCTKPYYQKKDRADRHDFWPRLWLFSSPFLFPPRKRGEKKRRMNRKHQKSCLSSWSKRRNILLVYFFCKTIHNILEYSLDNRIKN